MSYRLGLALLALVATLGLSPASPAGGPVGDGTPGSCTESALDARLAGGGNVTFSCGGAIAFNLTSVKIISQATTIDGTGGITLDGGDAVTIFSVNPGVTLSLKNLVLNQANGGSTDGGAIQNHGTLFLDHTTIQDSRTDSNHSGGAIFSDGPLFINASLFQDNQAGSAGALFANFGQATVAITNSTFSRNQALNGITGFGGALWVGEQARVSITGGTLISNSARSGGGVYLSMNATLTLTNAALSGNAAAGGGGGLYNSGGQLTLTQATLSGNSASSGGGLDNEQPSGRATMTHVTLSGNRAQFGGGGLYNNHGAAQLSNVIISGNVVTNTFSVVTYGGGIENFGALTLTNSTLSGNLAANNALLAFGGGLYNNQYTSQDTATLTNDTVSGNAAYAGGGILNVGTLTLTNTTLDSNRAASTGGGLENYQGTARLTNATLSGNSANTGGGLYQLGQAPTQTLTLKNTVVVSGLSGANCVEDAGSAGSLLSSGYNLSNEGTCTPFFGQPTDLNPDNPNLGPLADHGGPTLTRLPRPPSPAIDAIPNGVNGCGTTLTTDQRGAPRPINGQCDLGAVEQGWLYAQLWLAFVRR